MKDFLFHLPENSTDNLQVQVRDMLVSAILAGHLPAGEQSPSSRRLAEILGIGRNTVIAVFNQLTEEGYLEAKERRGYFVPDDMEAFDNSSETSTKPDISIDWSARLTLNLSEQRNIVKPRNWNSYDYPFITGQHDDSMFPATEWRSCSRDTVCNSSINIWAGDHFDVDHSGLVDQLRTRVLPRRGVHADPNQIIMTMGAQHALFMLGALLMTGKRVAIEDPGYPDIRNVLRVKAEDLIGIPVDDQGIVIDERLRNVDYVYVTPSHQAPTTVTMTLQRRKDLLAAAEEMDFVIIEDDYEGEINFTGITTPALYSLDTQGRVIYVGSLSKILSPGLRVGYMVAHEDIITEARALRRLMLRHTPSNNELTLSLFLERGHYDALIRKISRTYQERWVAMKEALAEYLPDHDIPVNVGGTAFWLVCEEGLDCHQIQRRAAQRGLLIETGDIYYKDKPRPTNYLRLGLSSIPVDAIRPGIKVLSEVLAQTKIINQSAS